MSVPPQARAAVPQGGGSASGGSWRGIPCWLCCPRPAGRTRVSWLEPPGWWGPPRLAGRTGLGVVADAGPVFVVFEVRAVLVVVAADALVGRGEGRAGLRGAGVGRRRAVAVLAADRHQAGGRGP